MASMLRSSVARLAKLEAASSSTLIRRSQSATRCFRRGGDHHGPTFNEPGGHFLNIPPAPAGYRRKKLWFENFWIYGFGGTLSLFMIALFYRPEDELDAWAREEARLRMEQRGEQWDTPGKPY